MNQRHRERKPLPQHGHMIRTAIVLTAAVLWREHHRDKIRAKHSEMRNPSRVDANAEQQCRLEPSPQLPPTPHHVLALFHTRPLAAVGVSRVKKTLLPWSAAAELNKPVSLTLIDKTRRFISSYLGSGKVGCRNAPPPPAGT